MTVSAATLEIYINHTQDIINELKIGNKKVTRKAIREIFELSYSLNKSQINAVITEYLRMNKK